MNQTAKQLLEFEKIKERLCEYAVSERVKAVLRNLEPSTDITAIEGWMEETTEARNILNVSPGVPLFCLDGSEKALEKLEKGMVLSPTDLEAILKVLEGGERIKRFMSGKGEIAPNISNYANSIYELRELSGEIDRCIRNGVVDDKASPELSKARKKIVILEDRIRSKLDSIIKSPAYKDFIQDSAVSMKNGIYVIPVKREHKRSMEGDVLDISSSGSTLFIEPAGVKKLREELNIAKIEEEKEEYRILSWLTGMVENCQREISINMEAMAHYEFVFIKAKLSKSIDGNSVEINREGVIEIKQARHPLLGNSAVPLDFNIGRNYRTLVITGPNTGGKTVALKTVGLLTMMAQSGLHVPLEAGSELAIFRDILVDIGDGQSIEQSLSTFSSHIKNIIGIIHSCGPDTLVILDELGTGTDPAEGMGLAVSVMEELFDRGATTIATTHYSEIKTYAKQKRGFENACMEFDINTLRPLYKLKIGEPGESNAFLISLRLGMGRKIIERAHEITYGEKKQYTGTWVQPEKQERNTDVVKPTSHTEERAFQQVKNKLKGGQPKGEEQGGVPTFKIGDCVYISSMNKRGIVCELENNKGDVGVMVMKNKFKVNKKRLSLYIDSKEMYPENYDFDIVFESKDNRKKRHKMGKRHVEGLVIEISKG
ncbi:MAG: hypothetical protein N2484_02715 [Clostridia bacterium]|nr:hypothetical protein [Clostridia bacterium]